MVNSIALNKINNFNDKFKYDTAKDNIENINNYLENLFLLNNVNINDILKTNTVLPESRFELSPDLYKYEKEFRPKDNIEIQDPLFFYSACDECKYHIIHQISSMSNIYGIAEKENTIIYFYLNP